MAEPKYDCSMGDPMDMLGEEACEVGKEVFKFKRFGHHPEGRAPGYTGPLAIEQLHQEIGDFLAVLQHLIATNKLDPGAIVLATEAKRERVFKLFGERLIPYRPYPL